MVTGHYLNDGLRHRMAQAGADFFFFRSNLRNAESLRDVVVHPDSYRCGVPPVADPQAREALGVSRRSQVDALVNYVEHHGLEDAFAAEDPRRDAPRSRRWLRHRRAMSEAAGVKAVNLTTGEPPRGAQDDPSIRQLRRVYDWAARVRTPDDGLS